MNKRASFLIIILALVLCLSMLVTGCGGGSKPEPDNGTTQPDPDNGITQPEPDNGTTQPDPDNGSGNEKEQHNLYRANNLKELQNIFSIYSIQWDSEDITTFQFVGTDEYGDKMILHGISDEITLWFKDGLITKVEPETWEFTVGTDGDWLFTMLFEPMFIFNDMHEGAVADNSPLFIMETKGTGTRDLKHMTLPVKGYSLEYINPATGNTMWVIEYWIGKIAGYDMTVEWEMTQADVTVMFSIVELKLRD